MQTIDIKGVGVLNEEQISNLIRNAKELKIENKILRQEICQFKEVSA